VFGGITFDRRLIMRPSYRIAAFTLAICFACSLGWCEDRSARFVAASVPHKTVDFLGVEKLADKWSEQAKDLRSSTLPTDHAGQLFVDDAKAEVYEECSRDLLGVLHPKSDMDLMVQHNLNGVGQVPLQQPWHPTDPPGPRPPSLTQPTQKQVQAPTAFAPAMACGNGYAVPYQGNQWQTGAGTGPVRGFFGRMRERRQSRRAGGLFGGC
jgi:hypothetical protein